VGDQLLCRSTKSNKTYQQWYTGTWTEYPALWSSGSRRMANLDQSQPSHLHQPGDGCSCFQQYFPLQNPPLGCPSGNWRLTALWETVNDAPIWYHPRNKNKYKNYDDENCKLHIYFKVTLQKFGSLSWGFLNGNMELVHVLHIQKPVQIATNYRSSAECLWPMTESDNVSFAS